jgi:hypothetical protein
MKKTQQAVLPNPCLEEEEEDTLMNVKGLQCCAM